MRPSCALSAVFLEICAFSLVQSHFVYHFRSGMRYDGKRVLVTGAGGFIGSHLTERLVELGAQVRVFLRYNSRSRRGWLDDSPPPVRDGIEVVWGDLKDPEAVRAAVSDMEVVFHLGALIAIPFSYQNPTDFFQTNVLGTMHVANACRECRTARVVHTSTSEVYGSALTVPMTEDHPQTAQSPYAAAKIGADRVMESYYLSFSLPVVTLRPFNTYGPRQSERAVIPTIVHQVLYDDMLKLGLLTPTRDFLYVKDTVAAFCTAGLAEGVDGKTLQFGTGIETSIGDLAQKVMRLAGREIPIRQEDIRVRPSSSEVDRLLCDATAFQRLTGWRPETTIDDGLGRVIDYYRSLPRPRRSGSFAL